jgi:hypothetical protein
VSKIINPRLQEPEEAGFSEIVRMIGTTRQRVMQAVNITLIDLYWKIGEMISRRVASAEWVKAR